MDMKNNFGQAMYEMFGVGKDRSSLTAPRPEETPAPVEDFREDKLPDTTAVVTTVPLPEENEPFRTEESIPTPPPSPLYRPEPIESFRKVETAVPVHSFEGTYLAPGTTMRGTLTARGNVEIAGDFEGDITTKGKVILHSSISSSVIASGLALIGCSLSGNSEISGDVTLDEQSVISGNVKAEKMICSGKIIGDLDIQDSLVLNEFAQIDGNIKVDSMSMARGAKITGRIEMRSLNS